MIGDTIWAVASAPGSAARGVIRVSGPRAFDAVATVLDAPLERVRGTASIGARVVGRTLAAFAVVMPGPRSFTGEDVVELHLPGSPLLLEIVGRMLGPLARPAQPGEFTRRAFEHGRLSLTQAEAVYDLIHAAGVEDARRASAVLGGALRVGVAELRARLDDARALIEAGLDFVEDETGAVDPAIWLPTLATVAADLWALESDLPRTRPGGDVLVLGAANAGKSSLCNALAGRDEVLVSSRAGTTRDMLVVEVGEGLRLIDTPGDLAPRSASGPGPRADDLDEQLLRHRDARIAEAAARALLVVDPRDGVLPQAHGLPILALVLTHADLVPDAPTPQGLAPDVPVFRIGSPTGLGVDPLARFLQRRGTRGPDGSGERVAAALSRARAAIARAADLVAGEMVACELADAISALDEIDGRSTPEDLLDRIFGRFCLGK